MKCQLNENIDLKKGIKIDLSIKIIFTGKLQIFNSEFQAFAWKIKLFNCKLEIFSWITNIYLWITIIKFIITNIHLWITSVKKYIFDWQQSPTTNQNFLQPQVHFRLSKTNIFQPRSIPEATRCLNLVSGSRLSGFRCLGGEHPATWPRGLDRLRFWVLFHRWLEATNWCIDSVPWTHNSRRQFWSVFYISLSFFSLSSFFLLSLFLLSLFLLSLFLFLS